MRGNDEEPDRQGAATNLPRERRTRVDTRQAPVRAKLLLAADFGREARGRPIHGRLESEDNGAGEPGPRLKIGAVRTRRLAVSEAADRPSGSAYGNPLRGTPESAPTVPIGAPLVAWTDVPGARGWRVYRVAPNGAVIYDRWIEHDPAHAEPARDGVAPRRRAATRPRQPRSHRALARQPGDRAAERPGETPLAGGTAAVAARPRAEGRPRMTPLARNRPARRGPHRTGTP